MNGYFVCQKLSKFSYTALAPFNLAHPVATCVSVVHYINYW